jgi:hypothetical protein
VPPTLENKKTIIMKPIKRLLAMLIFILLITSACNNASENNSPTKDTTAQKDTLRSNPENFSEPH